MRKPRFGDEDSSPPVLPTLLPLQSDGRFNLQELVEAQRRHYEERPWGPLREQRETERRRFLLGFSMSAHAWGGSFTRCFSPAPHRVGVSLSSPSSGILGFCSLHRMDVVRREEDMRSKVGWTHFLVDFMLLESHV